MSIRLPKPIAALLVAAVAASVPASANSGSGAGSTGATFLELGVGPRNAAMGEAGAAWADDVYGLYFNPAGIARASRKEIGFVHNNLFEDVSHNYIGYVHPLSSIGTVGASFTYVDLGEVRRTTVSSAANNAYLDAFSSHDLALSLTYARPVRSWLDLGATVRFINEKLDNYYGNAVAFDMGAVWHPPVPGLSVGVSLSNLGTSMKFVRERDELPLTLRAGAGWRSKNRIWGLTGDMVWIKRQDVEGRFGGEVWVWPEHLVLRGGFNTSNDAGGGGTVGGGFKWEDLMVDYAFTPFGDLGNAHQFGLTYQFGEPRVQPAGAVVAPTVQQSAQPDYGRVEPPLSTTAGSAVSLVYVLPFVYQSGPEGEDWIGSTIPEIFYHKWKPKGVVARSVSDARYTVEGNYWIVGSTMIINAELKDEGWTAKKLQWRGDAEKSFLLFDAMVESITRELRTRGVQGF